MLLPYGLLFFLSELFRIAVSCKLVNSLMKFKVVHKISAIQEKFLDFFNLLRGSLYNTFGGRIRPGGAGCASLLYTHWTPLSILPPFGPNGPYYGNATYSVVVHNSL